MKFLNVVGARPNFMKIAPFQRELERRGHRFELVHTGQHYDETMSDQFFDDLNIAQPDYHLGVGSADHTEQTARIMTRFEPIVDEYDPDWVIVVGDVNSTLATSLVTAKKSPELAHIEAGIRSGNRDMPEEINRIVVDRISDALFCFDDEARKNLIEEGISEEVIFLTGDIMIDSLQFALENDQSPQSDITLPEQYGVLTLHRPSNVDEVDTLRRAKDVLEHVSEKIPLVFPIHPRTQKRLKNHNLKEQWEKFLKILPPLGYTEFLNVMSNSEIVLTDSGSIQQETTVMNVPCLTLREETERGITVRRGTNKIVGWNEELILESVEKILEGEWKTAEEIPYWDGKTAERIVDQLESI